MKDIYSILGGRTKPNQVVITVSNEEDMRFFFGAVRKENRRRRARGHEKMGYEILRAETGQGSDT